MRTINELTTELSKAGLDPSRIRARADGLAKAQMADRKRKRDAEMDVDGDMDGEEGEGDDEWMDVDDEGTPKKRMKGVSGAVVAVTSRGPRSNRHLAGMRDQAVRLRSVCKVVVSLTFFFRHFSKRRKLSNCVTLGSDLGICLLRRVKEIVLSGRKWSVLFSTLFLDIF
jgi:hypothetical protein